MPRSANSFRIAVLKIVHWPVFDYTSYLFLDFHNGTPTVYLKYFSENENLEYSFTGYTTTEIIFAILELTIFSGKPKRNRS